MCCTFGSLRGDVREARRVAKKRQPPLSSGISVMGSGSADSGCAGPPKSTTHSSRDLEDVLDDRGRAQEADEGQPRGDVECRGFENLVALPVAALCERSGASTSTAM
jgi:hypothetical protein